MNFFSLFRRKGNAAKDTATPNSQDTQNTPAIPKNLFIEERKPDSGSLSFRSNGQKVGLDLIYEFLQVDYESKGFNDALTNPDLSYRDDNINLIKMDLAILIQKVDTYYNEIVQQLEFHIDSRKRAGLIDLVEELNSRKNITLQNIAKLNEIKSDIEVGDGITKRVVYSYQRGFLRGLAALSQSSILNRKM